jgi:YidC/Oxa1 family membrane protein insertase
MEVGLVWLAVTVGSAGIGIILFTIFVRAVLSPLQIVQLRNAKAMQRIQPLMQELRQQYGKDKQKLSEATMALYREHNINPALGCLPMVLQIPILIGLFYALLHLGSSPTGYPHHIVWSKITCNGQHIVGTGAQAWEQWLKGCYAIKGATGSTQQIFNLFHANFLWLSNGLGGADPLYILPILAGVTQWIQSRMMLTQSNDPQQQMMNTMMNFMPLMIIFFALRYPSGLALYWVTSTLIGIAIQYRITGWGLLPKPAQIMGQLFGPSPPTRPRSRPAPVNRPAPVKPQRQTQPPLPAAETELDGQDGNSDKPQQKVTAGTRPRRKANRARGGRGGGRRG